MAPRSYRARKRPERTRETRDRIKAAVRELLAEGAFHESTVEQVADRAGVARATVYQHFGSRLELVDAMCESFDENPALIEIRELVALPDSDEALTRTIANVVRFWSTEDLVVRELYGVSAIDPAARDLVDRQRRDRRSVLSNLARNLAQAGRLRDGMTERRALTHLMLLTSYETYRELREDGLSDRQATAFLQETAAELLKPH